MIANPVLAELVRGNWVENRHRGAFCVMDGQGNIIASAGDIETAIFPRSAIKSMQALALFRSGAVEKFKLDSKSIALACASHLGEADHVAGVRATLKSIGCTEGDLECGSHPPSSRAAREKLRNSGGAPGAVHNNCSGKHAGMLAVARALGVPTKNYSTPEHPVQKLVRTCIQDLMGEKLTIDRCGTDGCSIPTWAAPLKSIAGGFARMVSGTGLPAADVEPVNKIFNAVTSHPFLVAGTDAFDSVAMEVFDNRLVSKVGAEGVFCGALCRPGWGYALKCDDGNMAAAQTMVAALLMGIADPNENQASFLRQRRAKTITNWKKLEVGTLSATQAATPAI